MTPKKDPPKGSCSTFNDCYVLRRNDGMDGVDIVMFSGGHC
jgi:hypothetical protein